MANTMDASMLMKGLDAVNNLSKVAASAATLANKPPKKEIYKDGDTNQPHNQTVEVKVGEQSAQKPIILHEKKETHVHKPFPESRELSERECEVEKMRLQLEADGKKDELAWRREMYANDRADRKEREERERKERECRREKERKTNKRILIGSCIFGAALVGLAAYCRYSDSRDLRSGGLALQSPALNAAINAEGTVK